jgi:hypothetical protein
VLAAVALFDLLPYVEEFLRGLKARGLPVPAATRLPPRDDPRQPPPRRRDVR